MDLIQTTVYVQSLSNFTCRLWMMKGETLLILGHGVILWNTYYSRDLIFAKPSPMIYSRNFTFAICHIFLFYSYIRIYWRGLNFRVSLFSRIYAKIKSSRIKSVQVGQGQLCPHARGCHALRCLVTDIILNITCQEHLIFTSLHIGLRLFELFSKEVRVKKQQP